MSPQPSRRVLTVAPLPPEKCAYALARYSRSPDSIRDSIEWVRTHDSRKFLESFYFQYGHASIADLGHVVLCFEGVSELAATEIEDEQLWDGQARSSRYQDFSKSGFIIPPEFGNAEADRYREAGQQLLSGYAEVHALALAHLQEKLPRPDNMKPDAYERNLAARAFDVARYCLFFGIPTGVGQVTSIRTLERQIRRLRSSEYGELRAVGEETAAACADTPACIWNEQAAEPVAPTLAKYVDPDPFARQHREDLRQWIAQNLPAPETAATAADGDVDVLKPAEPLADIAATLLYPEMTCSFRSLYDMVTAWSAARQQEVLDVALRSRVRRDDLPRAFRTTTYVFDLIMDIGAYRDLHRHRRCQQFRQSYTSRLGYETPELLRDAGVEAGFHDLMVRTWAAIDQLPAPGKHYLLPFAARSRFLFKLDFAEAEYITRLRSGVKGHFSYRRIAWLMQERLKTLEPGLAGLLEATPPWQEDPLTR